jgi:DNA processing protein
MTVAVLGNGIDQIYPPENFALYRQIEEQGAVLSEFPFARRADRQSFAMRNRIVAGMSAALIVVESDVDGGSMITAKFAVDQGRVVCAVPGRIDQPTSAGCHQLIRDGAVLLTSVDDVLSELSYLNGLRPSAIPENPARGVVTPRDPAPELSEDEALVWGCFSGGALLALDELAGMLQRPASLLAVAVMRLELRRLVVKRADGRYEAMANE